MSEQPHTDPYSIPPRICLGIVIFGAPTLIAVMLLSALITPN
jgi:hypothetical protein